MENPFEIIQVELRAIKEELAEIKERQLAQPKVEIIDNEVLCKRLDVTRATLGRWRKQKKIPFIQEGGVIRYNYPRVIEALEEYELRKKRIYF